MGFSPGSAALYDNVPVISAFQAGKREANDSEECVRCLVAGSGHSPQRGLLPPVSWQPTPAGEMQQTLQIRGHASGFKNLREFRACKEHVLYSAGAEGTGQEGTLRILTLPCDQFDGFNIIDIFHCFSGEEEI